MDVNIYEAIRAGVYEPKLPKPVKPKCPELLRRFMTALTVEQANQVPQAVREYAAARIAYAERQSEYEVERSEIMRRFFDDLAENFNVMDQNEKDRIVAFCKDMMNGRSRLKHIADCYQSVVESKIPVRHTSAYRRKIL